MDTDLKYETISDTSLSASLDLQCSIQDDVNNELGETPRLSRKEQFDQAKTDTEASNAKFIPDAWGLYNLSMPKEPNKKVFTNEKKVKEVFGKYGEVSEVKFTNTHIYVRYGKKEHAEAAFRDIKSTYNLSIPPVKTKIIMPNNANGKSGYHGDFYGSHRMNQHRESDYVQIYIGNIPNELKKEDVLVLLDEFPYSHFKFYDNRGRKFGFLFLQNMATAKKVIGKLNGKMIQDRSLVVRLSRDSSRARIIESGGGYNSGYSNYPNLASNHNPGYHGYQSAVDVWIGNLPSDTSTAEVRNLLAPFGNVLNVKRSPTEKSVRSGWEQYIVTLPSQASAMMAVYSLNGSQLRGQRLGVRLSTTSTPQVGAIGRGNGREMDYRHGLHRHGNGDLGFMPMSRVQQAAELVSRIQSLSREVLDDCAFCQRMKDLIQELQMVMQGLEYGGM